MTPRPPTSARRVCVVEQHGPVAKRIAPILTATVTNLELSPTLEPALGRDDLDIVVVAYESLSTDERTRLISVMSDPLHRTRFVVVTTSADAEDHITFLAAGALTNLVARTQHSDGYELIVTIQKLLRRDIFGIEKYIPWGVEPTLLRLQSSAQREEVANRAEEYARNIGISDRFTNVFCTVVDELMTNALYNAPVTADGKHRFATFSRSERIDLADHEVVDLKLAFDGRRLGVSISDPFGSIRRETIVGYLAKCFRRGKDQLDQKPGGAGLGLYFVFDSVAQFVVNLSPGKRTEMIGFLNVDPALRKLMGRSKSFNIFLNEEGAEASSEPR